MKQTAAIDEIIAALDRGSAVPYLGPGLLELVGPAETGTALPASADDLVGRLTAKASVPHKIRKNLTGAAQFIENFRHRRTVKAAMTGAFRSTVPPAPLHRYLASLPALPLMVHTWYDDLPQKALASRSNWGAVQGISQAEHFGTWVHYFNSQGVQVEPGTAHWDTLLYQPIGSVSPAENYLVSDSDYVEVLTEIDIQTPIPEAVQRLRTGRHFLFLGCRFANQLDRLFARQIMKRSSAKHWAVLPLEPTRNELRFLAEQNIERIDMPLASFADALELRRPAAALAS
jgi:hypothetical protein